MAAENVFVDLRSAEKPITHRRLDHRGTHSVDPDTILSSFQRRRLGQPNHSVVARTVGPCARRTNQARNRRHVYDGSATALLEHLPNLVLHGKPDALEIDVDGPIPVLFGLSGDGHPDTFNAGVVESDVEAAKPVDRLPD